MTATFQALLLIFEVNRKCTQSQYGRENAKKDDTSTFQRSLKAWNKSFGMYLDNCHQHECGISTTISVHITCILEKKCIGPSLITTHSIFCFHDPLNRDCHQHLHDRTFTSSGWNELLYRKGQGSTPYRNEWFFHSKGDGNKVIFPLRFGPLKNHYLLGSIFGG